jgi:hypothetical protein
MLDDFDSIQVDESVIPEETDPASIKMENSDYLLTFYRDKSNFSNVKEFTAFVKKVEMCIRRSPEYSDWRDFIKDDLGNDACVFTSEIAGVVTIELHHHPLSLYDICTIVILDYFERNKQFTSLVIANEILKLHYKNAVGYVPIVTTLHEKYHSGALEIPIEYVEGKYKLFLDKYANIIDKELDIKSYLEKKIAIHIQEGQNISVWQSEMIKKTNQDVA